MCREGQSSNLSQNMPVTRIGAVKENSVNGDDLALFQCISNRLLAAALPMGLVVNEVAMGQGSFRALRFSLSISQPVLYIF